MRKLKHGAYPLTEAVRRFFVLLSELEDLILRMSKTDDPDWKQQQMEVLQEVQQIKAQILRSFSPKAGVNTVKKTTNKSKRQIGLKRRSPRQAKMKQVPILRTLLSSVTNLILQILVRTRGCSPEDQ